VRPRHPATAALLAALAIAASVSANATPAGAAPADSPAAALVAAIEAAMVRVGPGSFVMGSDSGSPNAKPPHAVSITKPFLMLRHEVTFDEYDAYCASSGAARPRDSGWGRGSRPVIFVSWYDAARFCNYLSLAAGLSPCYSADGKSRDPAATGYRLPTEAEWEYAARGGPLGTGRAYAGSDDPAEVAVFGDAERPAAVESRAANEAGLYDMSGNVHEWCDDWYAAGYYAVSPAEDPPGPTFAEADRSSGIKRIRRGGNYHESAQSVSVFARSRDLPSQADSGMGFRVVREDLGAAPGGR